MLKLLTKTKPWMVASLLVATTVFGQDSKAGGAKSCAPDCKPKCNTQPCPQPCPPTQMCPPACPSPCCPPWPVPVLNAAYNYPARTMVRCPWDIYFDVSFIYWQPIQENMEIALVNNTAPVSGTFSGVSGAKGISGNLVNADFSYKPGFKIGFGGNFDHDNWDVHAEYTWFHGQQHTSTNGPATGQVWATQASPFLVSGLNVFNSASNKWKLNMDIVDLDLGRWGYVGTKFTVRPSFGARAAFIRQNSKSVYTNTSGTLAVTNSGTTNFADVQTVVQKSHNWGIGPKFALDTNWMVGCGFRFFGNAEADILYTKYTKVSINETHTAPIGTGGAPFYVSQKSIQTVRTHVDLEFGLGWGMYWDCNNWYTDIALGYEFQTFFDQNMFRNFHSNTVLGSSHAPNGNLYLQGLTAQFRLDF